MNKSENTLIPIQADSSQNQQHQSCPNGTVLGSPNGGNCYLVEKLLGKGGFGEVYLASQIGSGMKVAVKKLLDECYKDKKIVDRFVNEINALKTVQHCNIVKMHERLEVDDHLYIVMEFVKGKTLEDYITSGTIFSEMQVVEFALILADALETVHKANIIHRDVKASNLMLSQNGKLLTLTLLDFGIVHVDNSAYKTQTGIAFGTPQYMSPEQCYGQEVDKRSDIYSFGIVLYFLECSRLPFDDPALWRVMQAQCQQPIPNFSRADGTPVHPEIERIARQCLAKDRDFRYQSFSEVIDDLKKIVQIVPASKSENDPGQADITKNDIEPIWLKYSKLILPIVSLVLVLIAFTLACILAASQTELTTTPQQNACIDPSHDLQTQDEIDKIFENTIAPALRSQILDECKPDDNDVAHFDIKLTGSTMNVFFEPQYLGSHKADFCIENIVRSFNYKCYLKFNGIYQRSITFKK